MRLEPKKNEMTLYSEAFRLVAIEGYSKEAMHLIEEGHAKGDPRATYSLATLYLFGEGRRKNFKKANELLQIAVDGGIARAAFDLAVSYETGKGILRDNKKAFSLYVLALTLGDMASRAEIARCYYYGIGVEVRRDVSIGIYKYLEEFGK